jgi:MFS family permease
MVLLVLAPVTAHLQIVWASAVVLGAGNTVFVVALRTSVPDLSGSAARQRGNGYLVTAKAFGTVLGFAAAGPLIGTYGHQAAFAVNAGSFVVSATVLAWLPLSFDSRGKAANSPSRGAGTRWGLPALLMTAPAMTAVVGLRGIEGWGSASHNVVLPVFAESAEPANPAALLSQFWTAWAVGSLSMYWVVTWWRRGRRELDNRVYAGALGLASAAFIAAFLDVPRPVMVLFAVLAGFADGLAELAYVTSLQTAPDSQRAAVFGASAAVETLGLSSGMLCSAVLLDRSAPLPVVALFHGVVILAAVAYPVLVRPRQCQPQLSPSVTARPQERNGE